MGDLHTRVHAFVYGIRVSLDSMTVSILKFMRIPNDLEISCNGTESRSRVFRSLVFSVVIEFARKMNDQKFLLNDSTAIRLKLTPGARPYHYVIS